jgi:urease accessory protein
MTATARESLLEIQRQSFAASRVRASLRLGFSRDSGTGNTVLSESLQEPPLKVVRAFTLEDGTALAHLHNVSGGLLGGDQLSSKINLERGTSVQLTTTGATRIYRGREKLLPTTQCSEVIVGEDALLEYVPDATIPFAGARFIQRTSIALAAGAGLFWWEILAPGREASGEIFEYEHFEMRTRTRALGRLIAAENICLRPASRDVTSLARLGPHRYSASFYICRVGLDSSYWRTAEEHVRELTSGLSRSGEILWGVSSLVADGLLVRCLARCGREILPGLQAIWGGAKQHLYAREAILPRKVN